MAMLENIDQLLDQFYPAEPNAQVDKQTKTVEQLINSVKVMGGNWKGSTPKDAVATKRFDGTFKVGEYQTTQTTCSDLLNPQKHIYYSLYSDGRTMVFEWTEKKISTQLLTPKDNPNPYLLPTLEDRHPVTVSGQVSFEQTESGLSVPVFSYEEIFLVIESPR